MTEGAFCGDFKGSAWNSQALLAATPAVQNPKVKHAFSIANNHDFEIVNETHGTDGKEDVWHTPQHLTAFLSHNTARTAGTGIIVQKSFLKKFDTHHWINLIPGWLASLKLRGPLRCYGHSLCVHADWKLQPAP